MNQPQGLKGLPAVSLVGEPKVYEAPDGILKNPRDGGRENEKLTSFEYIHETNAAAPDQVDLGIRIVDNNTRSSDLLVPGVWDFPWKRPKFNLYLRNDYEASTWDYPLFQESQVKKADRLRLRLGHQDFPNPFIIDEFVRRTFINMGQVNASGKIVVLYQNGVFRTHANLVERHREKFFQESYDSNYEWDVRHNTGEMIEGDEVAWEAFDTLMTSSNFEDPTDYAAVESQIDLVNFVDYLNSEYLHWLARLAPEQP